MRIENLENDPEIVVVPKENFCTSGHSVGLDVRESLVEEPFLSDIKSKAPKPEGAEGDAILVSPLLASVSSTVSIENSHLLLKRDAVVGVSVLYPAGKEYVDDRRTEVIKPCISVEAFFDVPSFVLFHPSVTNETEKEAVKKALDLVNLGDLKWERTPYKYGVVTGDYDRSQDEEDDR